MISDENNNTRRRLSFDQRTQKEWVNSIQQAEILILEIQGVAKSSTTPVHGGRKPVKVEHLFHVLGQNIDTQYED